MNREYARSLDFEIDYITVGSLKKDDVGDTVIIHSGDTIRWSAVSIYEDLFQNFMTCEIVILDQDGFFLNRFRTEEVIVIKYKTPDLTGYNFESRTHYFYLYKIDPVLILNKPYGALYTIKGVSFEYFYNSLRTFSKAYGPEKTEDIVKKIYTEFLEAKTSRTVRKELKVGRPTKHEMKFTFPYLNPVDAINHLASVSIDSKNPDICNYVFFENKDGFNFISITELIENPRKTHRYVTKKVMDKPFTDFATYFNNTITVKPIKTGDKIIDTLDGVHGEYFAEFDLLYKSYRPYISGGGQQGQGTYGKRYLDYFPKTKHLNNVPLLSRENEIFKYPLGRNRVCFTNAALYDSSKELANNKREWTLYDTHEGEYSFQRRSMMQQMNAFTVEITVPGNSDITVGDILLLDTVIYRTEDRDKYLSGKYLVTAVNHIIALDGYKTVVTISRDSLVSDDFDDSTDPGV